MSKRESIEDLEARLQEARRLKALENYDASSASVIDPIFKAWGEQLKSVTRVKSCKWCLAIYPPAGPQWRFHGTTQAGESFHHSFTLKSYFGSACRDWNDPHFYYSDEINDLIPTDWELLRLFGVIFFIYKTDAEFKPGEPYRAIAEPGQPFNDNNGRNFRSQDVVLEEWAKMRKEELPWITNTERIHELQSQKAKIEKEIEKLEQRAVDVAIGVFPYWHTLE
jgi:hypothetical protein